MLKMKFYNVIDRILLLYLSPNLIVNASLASLDTKKRKTLNFADENFESQPIVTNSIDALVETAVTFYMLQACMQGNFL